MNRYIVVALDRTPPAALPGYLADLLAEGIAVDLVLVDEAAVRRFADTLPPAPGLTVRAVLPAESQLLAYRLGRLLGPLRSRYDRLYVALARPWLLGLRWRGVRANLNVAEAQRLVAADFAATTLVWHLSRRFPHIGATTSLDPPASISRRSP